MTLCLLLISQLHSCNVTSNIGLQGTLLDLDLSPVLAAQGYPVYWESVQHFSLKTDLPVDSYISLIYLKDNDETKCQVKKWEWWEKEDYHLAKWLPLSSWELWYCPLHAKCHLTFRSAHPNTAPWFFSFPTEANKPSVSYSLLYSGLITVAESVGVKLLPPRKKITVLLMGNHSAGKSSFINW